MAAMAAQVIMQVQALPPVVAVVLVAYLPFHLVLVLAVSAAYMSGKHFAAGQFIAPSDTETVE